MNERTANRVLLLSLACGGILSANAQTLDPFYAGSYSLFNLGEAPGVNVPYGGLTLLAGDSNTLLLGGFANAPGAQIFSVGLNRDAQGHITGFSGPASVFAEAPFIDGGLAYGPGGVLFATQYPINSVAQIKPGSSAPDKTTSLSPLGYGSSVGGLAFVPPGHSGEGDLKLVVYNTGQWYSATVTPDGSGTFDISAAGTAIQLGGGPEGIAYVPLSSPLFPNESILVSEYSNGRVAAYDVDANGDPIPATRRDFVTGLSGAEGAFIDPVTGDFLFSTFFGQNQIIRVSGFTPPTPPPPPPPTGVPDAGATAGLLGLALGVLVFARRQAAAR